MTNRISFLVFALEGLDPILAIVDIRSHPRAPRYKTKTKGHKFRNKILAGKVPGFSIEVGRVILLTEFRNGCFGGGWLLTPSQLSQEVLLWFD